MKFKLLIALCLLAGTCFAQQKTTTSTVKNNNTSITVTENNNGIELSAGFDKERNSEVLEYMDDCITKGTGFSFKNTSLDADMTLSNHISFYVRLSPGKLNLKCDKRKNSAEIYDRFKKCAREYKACLPVNDISNR